VKGFQCKIINNTGTAVRVKLVAYKHHLDIDVIKKGEEEIPKDDLAEGEWAVVAFDYPSGKILSVSQVTIDESKNIEVTKGGATATPWR
jgi:hypothetical protein